MDLLKRYFWNILISIDQFANTIFGGDPDNTLSSRFHGWVISHPKDSWQWKFGYYTCRALHWIDKDHCVKSYEPDEGGDAVLRGIERRKGDRRK